jgi:signal transduction histidine kinase
MTPFSTAPNLASRERALRGLIAVFSTLTLNLSIAYILTGMVWRLAHPLLLLIGVGGTIVLLLRRQTTAASYVLIVVAYLTGIGGVLQVGYWTFGAVIAHILVVLVSAPLLPKASARLTTLVALLVYMLIVMVQYESGMRPIEADGLLEQHPVNAAIAMTLTTAILWGGIHILLAENRKRRVELRGLISSLEARVQERTQDLEAAVNISRHVLAETQLSGMMQKMVDTTKAAYPTLTAVSIMRYDPQEHALIFAAAAPDADMAMVPPGYARIDLATSKSRLVRVAIDRVPIVANNLIPEKHVSLTYLPGNRSSLLLPLIAKDELLGVLTLFSKQANYFDPNEVRMFTLLSQSLAASMQSALLYSAQVEANERLRRLDALKTRFLASVSHELKTPLSLSMTFTEFVSEGLLGPITETQREALDKAISNSYLLMDQLQELLDMSRLASGMLQVYPHDEIDLRIQLAEIGVMVRALLKDKPVIFIEDIDEHLPIIHGDGRRILQIFLNLLTNAAKFTEAGSITLSIKGNSGGVQASVIDTGPGIAADEIEHIWDPFHQAEAGLRNGGAGLGLAITRGLVEAHGGTLTVESTLGEGSIFAVYFPVVSKPAPKSQPRSA